MKLQRCSLLLTLLLATMTAPAQGANVTLSLTQPQAGTPLPATDVTSPRVLEIRALEAATTGGTPATQAKVFTYPLLHDSPDTSISAAFGTLPPGTYQFSMRFHLVQPADQVRVSMVAQPGSGDSTDFEEVALQGLSASRWYEVTGDVTVTGPDVWNGRLTLATSVASGTAGNPLQVWLDDLELTQDPDLPGDGCAPSCLRSPLDFESDPVGALPDRLLALVVEGTEGSVEVGDHLPWQALPTWYETSRVQIATRLRARSCVCDEKDDPAICQLFSSTNNTYDITGPTFLDGADMVQDLGLPVLTRHVKWGPEGPWWPTTAPSTSATYRPDCVNNPVDLDGSPFIDIADEIIRRAHEPKTPGGIDTRLIAYYWMMSDFGIRTSPPDGSGVDGWTALDPNGDRLENARGFFLTQNSPYPEVVADRLVEIANRDADGIFFDETHQPRDGDWSSWSEADFIAAGYGSMLPPFDPDDAGYWRLLDLYDQTVRSSFDLYHREVHRARAETALIVSAGDYQALWQQPIRSSFVDQSQVAKGEWHKTWRRLKDLFKDELGYAEPDHPFHLPARDLQSGFGLTLLRDTVNGRPPHIWVFRPAEVLDPDLQAAHVEIATTGLLTYGSVANLDLNEPRMRRVLELGQDLTLANNGGPYLRLGDFASLASSALSDLRPHRWVGIHFNEHARQQIYEDTSVGTIEDRYEEAWNQVIGPAVWSFAALAERGVPAGVVTDQHLARGELYGFAEGDDNAYDVLFLPSLDLTAEAQAEVEAFKAGGGRVICSEVGPASLCTDSGLNGQPWTWHAVTIPGGWDTSARDQTIDDFLDAIAPNLGIASDGRVLDAPVEAYFLRDTATGLVDVAPHIGAFVDPAGSGRVVVALSNRWSEILGEGTIQDRIDFEPPEIGGTAGRIYLRGGVVDGSETFCYATLEDPTWKTIDAQHLSISLTAPAGVRAIIKLDDGDADSSDDLNFQYGLLIEVKPTGSCGA